MVELVGSYVSGVTSAQDKVERASPAREAGNRPQSNVSDEVNVRIEASIGKAVLEVVDTETGNVIRQIPTPAAIALQELQNELLTNDYDFSPDVEEVVQGLESGELSALADETFDPYLREMLEEQRMSAEAAREFQIKLAAFYSGIGVESAQGTVVDALT